MDGKGIDTLPPMNCSWSGKNAHILREGRKVKRCDIVGFDFRDGEIIGIKVHYRKDKAKHTTVVSPIEIAALHLNWVDGLVASDSEDDDEDDDENKAYRPGECVGSLPPLTTTDFARIPKKLRKAFVWTKKSADGFLGLIFKNEEEKT